MSDITQRHNLGHNISKGLIVHIGDSGVYSINYRYNQDTLSPLICPNTFTYE